MRAKSNTHRHVGPRIFQDQIPADNPRHQFAQRRVGIRIRRPRNRNHRSQFGIAKASQAANERHQHQRNCDRRTRPRTPARERRVPYRGEDDVGDRSLAPLRHVRLASRDRRPDYGKNPRANHRADPQRRQRPGSQRLLKTVLRILRVQNQLVDGLAAQQLASQGKAPSEFRLSNRISPTIQDQKQTGPAVFHETPPVPVDTETRPCYSTSVPQVSLLRPGSQTPLNERALLAPPTCAWLVREPPSSASACSHRAPQSWVPWEQPSFAPRASASCVPVHLPLPLYLPSSSLFFCFEFLP